MKQFRQCIAVAVGVLLAPFSYAQESFTTCSAAFVGGKMVVNEYSPKGQCRLSASATGDLTVQTVDLSPTETKALDKLAFRVAIRDKATGTLTLYSDQVYRQVPVQQVLTTCKKGDHIVLLTTDQRYALPHNEILVQ